MSDLVSYFLSISFLKQPHLPHNHSGAPVPLTPHPAGLHPSQLGGSAGLLALSGALGALPPHLAGKDGVDKKPHLSGPDSHPAGADHLRGKLVFYYMFKRRLVTIESIFHISNFPLCCHPSALVTNLQTCSCFSRGGRARAWHSKYLHVYPQSLLCICLFHSDGLVWAVGVAKVQFDFLLRICAQFEFKPAERLAARLGSVRRTRAGSLSSPREKKTNEQTRRV